MTVSVDILGLNLKSEGSVHFFLECQDTLNKEQTFSATKKH